MTVATVSVLLAATMRVDSHVCAVACVHAHCIILGRARTARVAGGIRLRVRERRQQQLENQQQRREVRRQ